MTRDEIEGWFTLAHAKTVKRLKLATTKAFRAKYASVRGTPSSRCRSSSANWTDFWTTLLRKVVRETVPALMKALARPDLEVAEVIRLNITQAEAKALRKWAAKNLLPKPKKRKRITRQAPTRPAATTRRTGALSAPRSPADRRPPSAPID